MDLKILKIKKSFKKKNYRPNPDAYWKFLFFLGFFLTLISLFYGIYFFIQINKESFGTEIPSTGQVELVKKERIDKVLNYFTERESKSTDIFNFPSPIIDPSL